jgi:2',3'-cyclic-nucleotide 2'-phosphodiesterase (5'-nucleotidase family)
VKKDGAPVLVLDAGDALAASGSPPGPRDVEKARMILAGMSKAGTAGMAVGDRDLVLGVAPLQQMAKEAGVPLLAANLLDAAGKPLFERSRLVTAGATKVGLLAVYAPGDVALPAGITLADPVRTARDVAFELRGGGAGLIVALVHGPTGVAEGVAAIPGIHVVVPSHDGVVRAPYQPAGQAFLVAAGQKGRDLTRVSLHLEGSGPLADGGAPLRAAEEARYLEQRIADARDRAARTEGPGREAMDRVVKSLEARLAESRARAAPASVAGSSFRISVITLDEEVPDQPEVAALVKRFEERFPSPAPQ